MAISLADACGVCLVVPFVPPSRLHVAFGVVVMVGAIGCSDLTCECRLKKDSGVFVAIGLRRSAMLNDCVCFAGVGATGVVLALAT